MNELEPATMNTGGVIILPTTGEVVDVSEPSEAARALDELNTARQHISDLRQYVVELLWQEGERLGTKTLHFDDLEVSLYGGTAVQYDVEKLRDLLTAAGCPPERIERLIKTKVEYTVDGNVARSLAGINDDYAAALEHARDVVPARRGARVVR
jgi:hypothetical protein